MTTVETCGFRLSEQDLPPTVPQESCERSIWSWSEDERCILHTKDYVEETDELEEAIIEADRIDGLNFRRQSFQEGFQFKDIALYGANFQNADLTQCQFRNTDIINSRFEGANLSGAYFGPDESADDEQGVVRVRYDFQSNDFDSADLSEVTFEKVDLMGSKFDCENMRSVDFIDCSLSEIEFTDQILKDSDFSFSLLRKTKFEKCDLHNSVFNAADLEQSMIINSNLRNSDLRSAVLDQTEFDNVQINPRTQFDTFLVQEYLADKYSQGELSLEKVEDPKDYLHNRRQKVPIPFGDRMGGRSRLQILHQSATRLRARLPGKNHEPDYDLLEHARYRYRDISQIFSANGEPERSREYSIREKHAKRKNALRNDESSWLWLVMTRWAMTYGEEPTQPLRVAGFIVILSALTYPIFGVIEGQSDQVIQYCLNCQTSFIGSLQYAISIFHLSIVRLFTPTNPDVKPVGIGLWVGIIESISGALLTAMFVFTLGRRATE